MAVPARIGRYEVLNLLGAGGMAAVYLAHDPHLQRQVAIKVLHEGTGNAELRERFEREATIVARLQHPNIVTVFDVGVQDGSMYVVMEYLSGRPLSEVIRDGGLSLGARLQIMVEICGGLAYAHKLGLVHRDVKPANVIVQDDGTVKILDFGLARLVAAAASELTQAGTIFGTPSYMAPEAVRGERVDYRADVFAAGLVFYELLTGRKAFHADSPHVVLHRIVSVDPDPPSRVVSALPAAVDAIVGKSLMKDPAARYQDMAEMAGDLLACIRGLPEAASKTLLPPAPPLAREGSAAPVPAATPIPKSHSPAVAVPALVSLPPSSEATRLIVPPPASSKGASVPASDLADGTMLVMPVPSTVQTSREERDLPDARLVVSRSPDPHISGRAIPLSSAGVTLGRSEVCEVVINDPGLSRRHARIEWGETGFVVRDLGSSNGTFVNGRRVRENRGEPLFLGASIALADTALTFAYGRDTTLPDLTGVLIAGRYRLERLLRESAKAAVYAARDANVPREVAIKVLSPELARYAGYREQFEREASTAALLQHPHVCQVLDSGLTRIEMPGGRPVETYFLCYELMAGGSLGKRLSADDPLAPADVARWIGMLGSALGYVHERGLVHGDLKPAAIVFDAGGHLYLTDFSFAQKAVADRAERTLGSPAFMAPEQWDGEAPTAASDQFAFAALAYFMITGSRPFDGQDNPEIRSKNFRRGALPAHTEAAQNGRPNVSRAVSEVLNRALAIAPAGRYASVEQFSRALLKALGTGHVAGAEPLVFVSYDRELSGGWARFFADRLASRHAIRVFLDTTNLDRAGRFSPRLQRAIEDCDVFVCFLAGATLQQSKWVVEEVRLAHQFGKMMIPIFQESFVEPELTDESEALKALMGHQGIKLFDISGHFVDHAVADLAQLVKDAVSGEAGPV